MNNLEFTNSIDSYLIETTRRGFNKSPYLQPNRYVWHLTLNSGNRYGLKKRESILKYGLLPEKSHFGFVFVNNQIHDPQFLWPVPIDKYDYDFDSETIDSHVHLDQLLLKYDVWRIDTHMIPHVKWKIDPNLLNGHKSYGCKNYTDYLCTEEIIPTYCMKLFVPIKYAVGERVLEVRKLENAPIKKFDSLDFSPGNQNKRSVSWLREVKTI